MRAQGFSRWTRRRVCRTSSSAAAVTVQVFRTTRSAWLRWAAASRPLAESSDSRAAPSAWVARHPKFWTKNFSTGLSRNGLGSDIGDIQCRPTAGLNIIGADRRHVQGAMPFAAHQLHAGVIEQYRSERADADG